MSQMNRRSFAAGLLGLASGCVPAWLKEQVERMEANNLRSQRIIADLKEGNQQQAVRLDILEREFFNEKFCRGGKNNEFNARIIQFIRDVEKGIPGACSQASTQEALYFLGTQAYTRSYFRPNESPDDIRKARKGHLLSLLDPKWFHPSTRLLLLMQPQDETTDGQTKALQFGEEFKKYVQRVTRGRELRFVGPHLLPCRLRTEIERRYHGPMDITLEGEPAEGSARICAWTIRTDCG